jgi:hypothetical protein
VLSMARIDWDWCAELETCQIRIAGLEAGIASQDQKTQRLSDRGMDAEFAQRVLGQMKPVWSLCEAINPLIETKTQTPQPAKTARCCFLTSLANQSDKVISWDHAADAQWFPVASTVWLT